MNLSVNQKLTIGALTTSLIIGTGFFMGSYASSAEVRKTSQKREIENQKDLIFEKDKVIDEMLNYVDQLELRKIPVKLNVEKDDKKCMALTAFWEAGNHNSNEEMIKTDVYAIASTVINRAKNRKKSICAVTYQKTSKGSWEYSWRGDHSNNEADAKKYNPKKWEYAVQVTEGLLAGKIDPIENLEFYNNPNASTDKWHTDQVNSGKFFVLFSVGINKKSNREFHQFYLEKGKSNEIKQTIDTAILNKMKGLMK